MIWGKTENKGHCVSFTILSKMKDFLLPLYSRHAVETVTFQEILVVRHQGQHFFSGYAINSLMSGENLGYDRRLKTHI